MYSINIISQREVLHSHCHQYLWANIWAKNQLFREASESYSVIDS